MPQFTSPSIWNTYRVAALRDSSVFELPEKAEPTTKDGDPWLRWANVGSYSGWYSIGEREPAFGDHLSFWEAVLTLATEVGNGKLDAVHCVGPGILSVGGLGVTVASGYAQALLADCLEVAPLQWVSEMGPALETGTWIKSNEGEVVFSNSAGSLTEYRDLNMAIRKGALRTWSGDQKRHAKVWVQSVAKILGYKTMDKAQVEFCRQHVPSIIDGMQHLLHWPKEGVRDAWMYTPEQQALWCVAMVCAIEDEAQTYTIFQGACDSPTWEARSALQRAYDAVGTAARTESFTKRLRNAVVRCQELFRVTVLP